MKRRSFLWIAIAGTLSALLPPRLMMPPGASGALPDPLPGWSAAARRSARRIGRAYLKRHPDAADAARLRHLLHAAAPERAAGFGDRLRACIRDDFAHERVVQVEGWLLSQTEARLFALAALG